MALKRVLENDKKETMELASPKASMLPAMILKLCGSALARKSFRVELLPSIQMLTLVLMIRIHSGTAVTTSNAVRCMRELEEVEESKKW
jgi:hypothetical protein